jgi:molecular chaperone HscB
MNYFDFFDIPVSFSVDEAALRSKWLRNSRQYHPDFHTQADDAAQAAMLEQSSRNNEAYRVLSDPDLRMGHVLACMDALPEEGASPPMPQDFLMEMMDINEALMELEFGPDSAIYDQALADVERVEEDLQASVQPLLQGWSPDSEAADLESIRIYYFKRKYLLRIKEKLFTFASAFEK